MSALRIAGYALVALLVVFFGIRIAFAKMFATGDAPPATTQKSVLSKDGALIHFEQSGNGPVVILVSGALSARDGNRPLARQLASSFTVINYDRRGRRQSTDKSPYSPQREVEDIEALADSFKGTVSLFGSSSGAVLALDAASALGPKVKMAFLYEPPFIVDDTHPPIANSLIDEINASLAHNDRNRAVTLFFGKGMGIPMPGVVFMRLFLPAWDDMKALAQTAPYDLTILTGTQSGKPLPTNRWSPATARTLVAVGSKSEPFFHSGAQALTKVLPASKYRSIEGLDHSAILLAPSAIAEAIRQFFNV